MEIMEIEKISFSEDPRELLVPFRSFSILADQSEFLILLSGCDSLERMLLRHFGFKALQSINLFSPYHGIWDAY
jgi:hypothetical protein